LERVTDGLLSHLTGWGLRTIGLGGVPPEKMEGEKGNAKEILGEMMIMMSSGTKVLDRQHLWDNQKGKKKTEGGCLYGRSGIKKT